MSFDRLRGLWTKMFQQHVRQIRAYNQPHRQVHQVKEKRKPPTNQRHRRTGSLIAKILQRLGFLPRHMDSRRVAVGAIRTIEEIENDPRVYQNCKRSPYGAKQRAQSRRRKSR